MHKNLGGGGIEVTNASNLHYEPLNYEKQTLLIESRTPMSPKESDSRQTITFLQKVGLGGLVIIPI